MNDNDASGSSAEESSAKNLLPGSGSEAGRQVNSARPFASSRVDSSYSDEEYAEPDAMVSRNAPFRSRSLTADSSFSVPVTRSVAPGVASSYSRPKALAQDRRQALRSPNRPNAQSRRAPQRPDRRRSRSYGSYHHERDDVKDAKWTLTSPITNTTTTTTTTSVVTPVVGKEEAAVADVVGNEERTRQLELPQAGPDGESVLSTVSSAASTVEKGMWSIPPPGAGSTLEQRAKVGLVRAVHSEVSNPWNVVALQTITHALAEQLRFFILGLGTGYRPLVGLVFQSMRWSASGARVIS